MLKHTESKAREKFVKHASQNKKWRLAEGVPPGAEAAADEGWSPFAWKHNALRHSFISYRVADIQDVATVSLEAGNSPQMIFKHYRELGRPQEARRWFAITPEAQNEDAGKEIASTLGLCRL